MIETPTPTIAPRLYECTGCGHRITTRTNHRGEIYPPCEGTCKTITNPHTALERVMWHPQTAHRFINDVCVEDLTCEAETGHTTSCPKHKNY